jgi:predicted RNA-binding Zn-ribbon protein involved in translation (DUF1610 family)
MASGSKGRCYLCQEEFGKTAMKNHILKKHTDSESGEKYYLLKVEGGYRKNYWLYISLPVTATLSDVDEFLRNIWLECCWHLSGFYIQYEEIDQDYKVGDFYIGTQLVHKYDFGSTTVSLITFLGEITRKEQIGSVQLLARNVEPEFFCSSCGEPATWICVDMYDTDNPFLCDKCGEKHDEDMMLPVTNSPRMGVCGYTGDSDFYF